MDERYITHSVDEVLKLFNMGVDHSFPDPEKYPDEFLEVQRLPFINMKSWEDAEKMSTATTVRKELYKREVLGYGDRRILVWVRVE